MRADSSVRRLVALAAFAVAGTTLAAPAKKASAPKPPAEAIDSITYVQADTATLITPKDPVSTRPVKVLLVTGIPLSAACYQPSADVSHESAFSHIISARSRAVLNGTCQRRRSRFDLQSIDLGRLAPGKHVIRVEDVVSPVAAVILDVKNGDVASAKP